MFNQGKSGGNERYFRKPGGNQGNFKFVILSFQSNDFLRTQPCIQWSITGDRMRAQVNELWCQGVRVVH